jgi:hypothetical protein
VLCSELLIGGFQLSLSAANSTIRYQLDFYRLNQKSAEPSNGVSLLDYGLNLPQVQQALQIANSRCTRLFNPWPLYHPLNP